MPRYDKGNASNIQTLDKYYLVYSSSPVDIVSTTCLSLNSGRSAVLLNW